MNLYKSNDNKSDISKFSRSRLNVSLVLPVVLIAFLTSTFLSPSVYAGFGGFMKNIQKNLEKSTNSSSSKSTYNSSTRQAKPATADEEAFFRMFRSLMEDRPERTNVEDEVGYGDTITAKMIGFYGSQLLDMNKYASVWKYCNLIAQSLGKTNVMRPKLSVDSTYTSNRIKNANEEDKNLFSNIGYHVGIIKNNDIGAVSAPGGYILITTGLLKACRCEAELAGVLAHEIAHISRSHGLSILRKKMKKGMPTAFLKAASGGDSDMLSSAIGALTGYTTFAYGRGEEFEADRYGAQIMYRTGYNPHAFVDFVSSLKSGKSKAYKSHPSSRDRANRLNVYVKSKCPGGENLPVLQKRYDREVRQKLFRR